MQWCHEVSGHSPQSPCLFQDALGVMVPGYLNEDLPYSLRLEQAKRAPLATRALCLQHGQSCILGKQCCMDVSGLPCPDMSRAGKQKKRAGSTSNVYLSHGLHTTHCATPLLLIECTEATLMSLISMFYITDYY